MKAIPCSRQCIISRKGKRKYHSILATEGHNSVVSMEQFENFDRFNMGFYFGRKVIGGGDLMRVRYIPSKRRTCLQTEGVSLNKKFRRKGHGIHLYHHLIAWAKFCGAERIYSSRNLNKFSRRMWSEKLAVIYNVVPVTRRRKCLECGCKGRCKTRTPKGYYIQLKGK